MVTQALIRVMACTGAFSRCTQRSHGNRVVSHANRAGKDPACRVRRAGCGLRARPRYSSATSLRLASVSPSM